LYSTGEKLLHGVVRALDATGISMESGGETVPIDEIVALRRADRPVPVWPELPHLHLRNGDCIAGTVTEIDGSFVHFRATSIDKDAKNSTLRLPLTSAGLLWLRSPSSAIADKFPALFAAERASDQVLLRNGDIVAGIVTGLDARKGELSIESGSERRLHLLDRVVLLSYSTRLTRVRTPKEAYGHLVLSNGTRLTVASPRIDRNVLTAQTNYKETIHVAMKDVAALDIYGGKATYLSDLKPTKYEYRSYQGEEFTWSGDRNLAGEQLQLNAAHGTTTFDKGIAVHGECQLSYALDGKYSRFEAVVGLDARLGKRGSVNVFVMVDGKEHKFNDGKPLTFESHALPVQINVKGANELTLVVKWGQGGNVGDHVNWCDARLIH
jgi:hypothetical protein